MSAEEERLKALVLKQDEELAEAYKEIIRLRAELKAHRIDPDHCDALGEHVRKNMVADPLVD